MRTHDMRRGRRNRLPLFRSILVSPHLRFVIMFIFGNIPALGLKKISGICSCHGNRIDSYKLMQLCVGAHGKVSHFCVINVSFCSQIETQKAEISGLSFELVVAEIIFVTVLQE